MPDHDPGRKSKPYGRKPVADQRISSEKRSPAPTSSEATPRRVPTQEQAASLGLR